MDAMCQHILDWLNTGINVTPITEKRKKTRGHFLFHVKLESSSLKSHVVSVVRKSHVCKAVTGQQLTCVSLLHNNLTTLNYLLFLHTCVCHSSSSPPIALISISPPLCHHPLLSLHSSTYQTLQLFSSL